MVFRTLGLVPPSYERLDSVGARCAGRRRTKSLWYPIWLSYPVGLLFDNARLFDAPAVGATHDYTLNLASSFDLVFSHPSEGSLDAEILFLSELKSKKPSVKTVLVGPVATMFSKGILSQHPKIDAIALDEYDFTIREMAVEESVDVPGVLYRNSDGDLLATEFRSKPPDLDKIAWSSPVYKRDLEIKRYYLPFVTRPYLQLYESRGCTSKCTFCLTPQIFTNRYALGEHNPVRFRSIEDFLAEMDWIKENLPQVREVFIDSDTLTDYTSIKSGRFFELCVGLGKTGIPWSCNVRADASRTILQTLKSNGCRLMVVGFESYNDNILRNIRKGISTRTIDRFVSNAKDLDLMIQACFIIGLPGETNQTVRNSMAFAIKNAFSNIQIAPAHAFTGTELYHLATKPDNPFDLRIADNLFDAKGRQLPQLSQRNFSSEDTSRAIERFLYRYLYHPRFWKRLLRDIRRPGEFERIRRNILEFHKDLLGRRFDGFRKSTKRDYYLGAG